MTYPQINFDGSLGMELEDFSRMDYYAVNKFNLPIELMMENAGLQLANLIAHSLSKNQIINIGVGNGNNGGGGLVAARRLAAWGYKVHLDIPYSISKELPAMQLKRALAFGVKEEPRKNAHVWVDAYFGFSQRLPLPEDLIAKIYAINEAGALLVSLDIPTGFDGN